MIESLASLHRPLCCRYLLVYFETLPIQVIGRFSEPRDTALLWGLGVLGDGQHEVLGVWPAPTSAAPPWSQAFERLRLRGVEAIRFATADASRPFRLALDAEYPDARSPGVAEKLSSLDALSRRQRCMAVLSEEAMPRLQRQARLAVGRRSDLLRIEEATEIVLTALERALRRIVVARSRATVSSFGSRPSNSPRTPLGNHAPGR